MADDKNQDLERQLREERERVRKLEEENAKLRKQEAAMANQLSNYKPMAEAWMREHMPSKEECEKELTEMLAHPENLYSLESVLRELEQEFGDLKAGGDAA